MIQRSPKVYLEIEVERAVDAHPHLERYTVGTMPACALLQVGPEYALAEIRVRRRGNTNSFTIHETGATVESAAANLIASLDGWADVMPLVKS